MQNDATFSSFDSSAFRRDGSLQLNLGMNRETTVTGGGFSTYVGQDIRPSAAARSTLCNALQQIAYRILYQSMIRMHRLAPRSPWNFRRALYNISCSGIGRSFPGLRRLRRFLRQERCGRLLPASACRHSAGSTPNVQRATHGTHSPPSREDYSICKR